MIEVRYTSIVQHDGEPLWSFTNRMAETEKEYIDKGKRAIFRQIVTSESGYLVFVLGYEYEKEIPHNGEPSFKEINL